MHKTILFGSNKQAHQQMDVTRCKENTISCIVLPTSSAWVVPPAVLLVIHFWRYAYKY
jgi:hypothetical protein